MSDERMSLLSLPLWTWLVSLVLLAGAVVWWIQPEDPGVPKPIGQVRITLPDTASTVYSSPCATSFRVPNHAKIERQATRPGEVGCWYNVSFPRFNARLHCTEMPVEGRLSALMSDAQSLVFGHEVAASGIRRQALDVPGKSGMLYMLEGPVATPLQFFVTDSTTHFMRGSLYFNHAPNPDSVAPVLDRMEADVRRIMETLVWS